MFTLFQIVFSPVNLFVQHPERAFLVGIGFAILFIICFLRSKEFKSHSHLLIAAFLWVVFGVIEVQALANGWEIRLDLMLSWPPVLAVTCASVWFAIRGIVTKKSKHQNPGQTAADPSLSSEPHH